MLPNQLRLRPCRPLDIPELQRLAAEDNHSVWAPTDIMVKNGKVVGYLSIGAIPFVTCWFDTHECLPRDSFQAINIGENIAERLGHKDILLAVDPNSPFVPVMQSMEYRPLGRWDMYTKSFV